MADRPYVVLSCAMSVDGYLDDASDERLVLSNAEDLDRVDGLRADCDAVLVGARTVRRDDPRLLVRSAQRRAARVESGRPADPAKVTLTSSGDLDPAAAFFAADHAEKIVYAGSDAVPALTERLGDRARVVDAGCPPRLDRVLGDLSGRGIARLLVEGGGRVHTEFLVTGSADELHLVVAPFFVGATTAPRFVGAGAFPHGPADPMELAEVTRMGDVVLLRYLLRSH